MSFVPDIDLLLNVAKTGKPSPETIRSLAREMEALFVYELLKAMRKTVNISSRRDFQKDVYTTIIDIELARVLSEKGLGLKEVLFRQLSHTIKENEEYVKETTTDKSNRKVFPAEGQISSSYGWRVHPVTGKKRFHYGIDISAPMGTEIKAVKGGKVIFSGTRPGYGNLIIIDHGDGFITKYAHNKVNLVKEGQTVEDAEVIALVGNSGLSTGPHLHFEVLCNGKHIDPEEFLVKT